MYARLVKKEKNSIPFTADGGGGNRVCDVKSEEFLKGTKNDERDFFPAKTTTMTTTTLTITITTIHTNKTSFLSHSLSISTVLSTTSIPPTTTAAGTAAAATGDEHIINHSPPTNFPSLSLSLSL